MLITKIEKLDKRYKIYIEDDYYFSLYYMELKRYNLAEHTEITDEIIEKIVNDIIIKRGKNYLYYLIAKRDYTYNELKRKLSKAGYRETYALIILDAIEDYGLIDDERYAKGYIQSKCRTKSKCEMMNKLHHKGIDKSIIQTTLEDAGIDEYEAAKYYAEKKLRYRGSLTFRDKEKVLRSLYRKGFNFEIIKRVLSAYNFINK